jgi:hypothetical protein
VTYRDAIDDAAGVELKGYAASGADGLANLLRPTANHVQMRVTRSDLCERIGKRRSTACRNLVSGISKASGAEDKGCRSDTVIERVLHQAVLWRNMFGSRAHDTAVS